MIQDVLSLSDEELKADRVLWFSQPWRFDKPKQDNDDPLHRSYASLDLNNGTMNFFDESSVPYLPHKLRSTIRRYPKDRILYDQRTDTAYNLSITPFFVFPDNEEIQRILKKEEEENGEGNLRNKEHYPPIDPILDVKLWAIPGSDDMAYACGYRRKGYKAAGSANAALLRRVHRKGDGEFASLLPLLLNCHLVSSDRYYTWPYPFKYLDEFEALTDLKIRQKEQQNSN